MRVLEELGCGLVGVTGRVVLATWSRHPADEASATRMISAAREEAERNGKIATLVCLSHHAPVPNDAVRAVIQTEMRRLDPLVVCGATVIDKAGFRGSALRAIVSTMQLLAKPTHPERVFAAAPEASGFLRAELLRIGFVAPSMTELMTSYEDLVSRARSLGASNSGRSA